MAKRTSHDTHEHGSTLNRRRVLQTGAAAIAAATAGRHLTFAQDSSPVAPPEQGISTPAAPAVMATPQRTVDADGYYPSNTPGVADAWTKMPEPYAATDGVPGSGGKVTAMVMIYGAPPSPLDKNQYWQGLNERLGVSWEPILVPNSSYGEKATAIIASGDLPDMFYLNFNQTVSPLAKFVQQGAFLDLTPYVTGDAIKEYPNLATFPDFMWEATMQEGKIYGVPCPSGRANQVPAFRTDWSKKFLGGKPKTAEELHDMLVACSKEDPDGNGNNDTWGMGRFETTWDMALVYPMFRAPNEWRVDDDGSFTSKYETDEWRMAVEFFTNLYKDGGFHPDSAAMQYEQALQLFTSGRVSVHADGGSLFGANGFIQTIRQYQPDAEVERLIPFGHDGGEGVTYNLPGIFGFTAIASTVTDEDRIHELLRIFNWLSSPFGSEEWLYKTNGEEGVHFEYNENGFPITNKLWDQENGGLTAYIGGNLLYNITPDQPEIAPLLTDEGNAVLKIGIDNPAANLFSPEAIDKSPVLNQIIGDGLTDVITGRSDFSHWDDVVKDWQSRGGDAMRNEYEVAYAANQE